MSKYSVVVSNIKAYMGLHFPKIRLCSVFSKGSIVNLHLQTTSPLDNLIDEIGFDSIGRYIAIIYGYWVNIKTNEILENTDIDDEHTEYVSVTIKIYLEHQYYICYHNPFGYRDNIVSLIPKNILDFSYNDSELIFNRTIDVNNTIEA